MENTSKYLATIEELHNLVIEMTMEDFIDFIKAEYNSRDAHGYIDFDYHDLTATICTNEKKLSGCFDVWDEDGEWIDTIYTNDVSFKE